MTDGISNNRAPKVSDEELIEAARAVMEHAYAPYSRFLVGAAIVSDEGEIYAACNVENASYGLTICAERAAVFKAVSEGETKITRIAIVSSSGEPTYPCGACRQVLNEFALDASVILADKTGGLTIVSLTTLLPHSFGPGSLK